MELSPSYAANNLLMLMYFLIFYGTLVFIIMFVRTFLWFLSPSWRILPISSHLVSVWASLLLSSHQRHGFPGGLGFYISSFPLTTYMHSCSSHVCYMPSPSPPHSHDHSNFIWQKNKSWSSKFCSNHLITHGSKYSPQHPGLGHPHTVFSP
jgi:hypothetical protein